MRCSRCSNGGRESVLSREPRRGSACPLNGLLGSINLTLAQKSPADLGVIYRLSYAFSRNKVRLLRKEAPEEQNNWKETLVGQDIFGRIKGQPPAVEDLAAIRPPAHPVIHPL
jgi:hypothetical protein